MTPRIYSSNPGLLSSMLNDLFNERFVPATKNANSTPAINILEDDAEYKVEVAAPGMTKQDFNIQIDNEGEMTISMEKKTESSDEGDAENVQKKYLRREFSYSKFQQSFTLPDNVKIEEISASMTDGVLTIDIPKMTEEQKAQNLKYIEIM